MTAACQILTSSTRTRHESLMRVTYAGFASFMGRSYSLTLSGMLAFRETRMTVAEVAQLRDRNVLIEEGAARKMTFQDLRRVQQHFGALNSSTTSLAG